MRQEQNFDGDWQTIRWSIRLDTPPVIVDAGIGVHGTRGDERYLLPELWCLHLYPYEASVKLGDCPFPIRPGFVGTIPPGMPTQYFYQRPVNHLFIHFRIPEQSDVVDTQIPAMLDMADAFPECYGRLDSLIPLMGQPIYRIQAFAWDLLCRIADKGRLASEDATALHPAVRSTIGHIAAHLGEPLSVVDLARNANVSYSYLARLFQDAFGTTVVGYIREERMRRAEHLLRHTTLPVKDVAAAVGIPDLHLFNKTVRRSIGSSPSAVRTGCQSPGSGVARSTGDILTT